MRDGAIAVEHALLMSMHTHARARAHTYIECPVIFGQTLLCRLN